MVTKYERIYMNAIQAGIKYLDEYKSIKSLIIGLSGGIDSAITAILARAVIDKLDRDIKLRGYSLPTASNKEDEIERARDVGHVVCHYFEEMDITGMVPILQRAIDPSLLDTPDKIRTGNLKARARMMFLYDKAAKYDGLVLSTDNYTEYLLGFWTLHGDVGDFGFIQNLWKSEVYDLAEWMITELKLDEILPACIEAKPTDGLGISNSDLDQLMPDWKDGYREGYRIVDDTLKDQISCELRGDDNLSEDNSIINRYLRTKFKRENPFNVSRLDLIKEK